MGYIVISIGNTDNKLTQQEWHDFVYYVNETVQVLAKVHYFGGSSNWEKWQNVCWICEIIDAVDTLIITNKLRDLGKFYKQDSVFVMMGDALFV